MFTEAEHCGAGVPGSAAHLQRGASCRRGPWTWGASRAEQGGISSSQVQGRHDPRHHRKITPTVSWLVLQDSQRFLGPRPASVHRIFHCYVAPPADSCPCPLPPWPPPSPARPHAAPANSHHCVSVARRELRPEHHTADTWPTDKGQTTTLSCRPLVHSLWHSHKQHTHTLLFIFVS